MNRKLLTYIAASLVLSAIVGCERREMLVISDGVLIGQTVDTSFVRTGIPAPKVPDLFRVFAYDSKTGKAVTSDFISSHGGQFHVPAGEYDVVTYNFGTEYCIVEDDYSRDGAYVHTSLMESSLGQLFVGATKVKSKGYSSADTKATKIMPSSQEMEDDPYSEYYNMPVVFQPDFFWRGVTKRTIPYRSETDPDMVIDVTAESLVKTGHVRIKGVTGTENIGSVTFFLTNLTRRVNIFSGKPFPEAAVVCFGGHPGQDGIEADFRSFGRLDADAMYEIYSSQMAARGIAPVTKSSPEKSGAEAAVEYGRLNELYVLVTDKGGGQYLWTFDVTGQVHEGSDIDLNMEIELNVDIPEPEHGGGGFLPSVGDWSDVITPVDI